MDANIPLAEQIPEYVLQNPSDNEDSPDRGKAFLSLCGSMLWPGIGHFIAGSFILGTVWCVLWAGIIAAGAMILLNPQYLHYALGLLLLAVMVQLVQMVDSVRAGRASTLPMLQDASMRFVGGGLLALIAIVGYYAGIVYLQSQWVEICYSPTSSMAPTIAAGDIFVDFRGLPFDRWDIVEVNAPDEPGSPYKNLVKRVVGMPGDHIEITGSGLMINNKLVTLPPGCGPYYACDTWGQALVDASPLSAGNGCWGRPLDLGPDEYFVLGDNNAGSYDARLWPSIGNHQPGAVPRDQIVGRIVARAWPPERWCTFYSAADKAPADSAPAHK